MRNNTLHDAASASARRQVPRLRAGAESGFTLLELLTVVTILIIMMVIAVPSYTRIVAAQRVRTATSDLFLSLVRARSEALKRSANISLTPNGSGWQYGWTMPDPNPGSSTGLIESHGATVGVNVTGPASAVIYQSSGRISSASATSCTSSPPVSCFLITSTSGSYTASSCVSIDLSGRPYSGSGTTSC